jgi:hypothetical protein
MKKDNDFRAVSCLLCPERMESKLDFSIERNKMELALRFEVRGKTI